MPKGIPLTESEIDRRRHEIFHSSVALILKQGFAGTSMQEIARSAGVGKSTLYDYFPIKDHVLLFMFEEELDLLQAQEEGIVCRLARWKRNSSGSSKPNWNTCTKIRTSFQNSPCR
jgi:AcrR family transcriptional regulator